MKDTLTGGFVILKYLNLIFRYATIKELKTICIFRRIPCNTFVRDCALITVFAYSCF